MKEKCVICGKKATYECEDCGELYCIECASEIDFEHDCIELPPLVKIND